MGTRHLTIVQSDNEYKVAQYGQWDGYPSGQGLTILDFLNKNGNVTKLKKKLKLVRFATENDQKEKDAFMKSIGVNDGWMNMEQADKYHNQYPLLSRDNGAKILNMLLNIKKEVFLTNRIDFAGESLFCEWAYVIDLDKNTLEVYKGFNKTPLSETDRFYKIKPKEGEYYQVKLINTYSLDKLPSKSKFVKENKDE